MGTTDMKNDFSTGKNSAAKTAKNVGDSIADSAPDVLGQVAEFGKSFLNSMSSSREKAMQTATSTLQSLDGLMKSKPWAFVGGAAVVGFVAGYLFGHGRSPTSALQSRIQTGVDKVKDQIEKNINKVSEHLQ